MRPISPQSDKARELLRGYLLGTVSSFARRRVERHLRESDEWRVELERQRALLAKLDHLTEAAPAHDLTARVLHELDAKERERVPARVPKARPYFFEAVVSVVLVVTAAAILLPALTRAREAARRPSVANTLKTWGIVFKMYAGEDPEGRFPPLTRYAGVWMPDLRCVYPEYVSDPDLFVNPRVANSRAVVEEIRLLLKTEPVDWEKITRLAAESFAYPGWVVLDDTDASRLAQQRTRLAAADYDRDITEDGKTLRRPRESIERFMMNEEAGRADAVPVPSHIPVMFENPARPSRQEGPEGCWVLYMDGHVEFVTPGAAFPVTDAAAQVFRPRKN